MSVSPKSPDFTQDNPTELDLSSEHNYLEYIKDAHPMMEQYIYAFLNTGFNYKIAHECLKNMYSDKNNNKSTLDTPSSILLTNLNKILFDETVKINDDFIPQYYGDGTYYLHDTGSITKFLSTKTFKEFLVEIGIDNDELDIICEDYPNIEPTEYIICLLYHVHNTLFPLTLPEFDKNNIIRWGREHLRGRINIDSYLLNYNSLKEFILKETDSNYIKTMLELLLEEFPNSKTVITCKKLISTGIIGDNTAHAKIYDKMEDTNIEKCRKFITNSVIVAKKPKNLRINGSSVEFISDKELSSDDLLDKIIEDMNDENDTNDTNNTNDTNDTNDTNNTSESDEPNGPNELTEPNNITFDKKN